eukprot:6195794-Pleurochrysis_carterae.AAC.5
MPKRDRAEESAKGGSASCPHMKPTGSLKPLHPASQCFARPHMNPSGRMLVHMLISVTFTDSYLAGHVAFQPASSTRGFLCHLSHARAQSARCSSAGQCRRRYRRLTPRPCARTHALSCSGRTLAFEPLSLPH